MKNTANKLLLFWALSTTLCSAQTYKLENFDSPERQKRIKDLVEYVERNEMNPKIKGIASEFAVDTFKIEHFRRKFSKENLQISLDVLKSAYIMYDCLNNKYLTKLKTILKDKDYDDLISSQESWENYRLKELNYLQRLITEGLDFEYNFYLKQVQILQFRLETLFFYYLEFEEFRY
jgi:hypothetical protein